uniref:Uncharacterized protein n=1 Tax=Rhizophora mucronata TaxID=61149 RepID=A0A2P2IL94_RHIMU
MVKENSDKHLSGLPAHQNLMAIRHSTSELFAVDSCILYSFSCQGQ